MLLKEIENRYFEYSKKAGELSRQFAYAGIAIIWIFVKTESDKISLPNELYYALIYIIFSLIADLSQYIYQSIIWSIFYGIKKTRIKEDSEANEPWYLNIISWVLFSLKLLFVIIAYFQIYSYFTIIIN